MRIENEIKVMGICGCYTKDSIIEISNYPGIQWRLIKEDGVVTKLRRITRWYIWRKKMWSKIKHIIRPSRK